MSGPSLLRRIRARGFDRRMIAGVFLVVAVAVAVAVSLARSSAPPRARDAPDPGAARELVALMRAGESARWLARYDFTRTLANGRTLTQPLTEARAGSRHVLVSGSGMTIEQGSRVEECSLINARASCHTSTRTGVVPASEVLRVAMGTGAYAVTRQPTITIAGVEAHCFRVRATGAGVLPDIGTETEACYSAAGVPLSQRVVRTTGDIDARVARKVRTDVDADAIDRLQRSFGGDRAMGAP